MHERAPAVDSRIHIQEVSEILGPKAYSDVVYPLQGIYQWQNGTFEGLMSSIALNPGVVEKRPERKGRKERDLGLVRDDAGPDLPG